MRVLVTGGAGFIGSHIVNALLKRGYEVAVLDNLSSGSEGNLKHYMKNPSFSFVKGDVRNSRIVGRAIRGVEAVIHEAAVVGVPLCAKDPELARSVNVDSTLGLLKQSVRVGIKRFVYASSAAVYGKQEKLPISEDAPPKPLSLYASSKLAAEQNCITFYKREGLETVCLRYFNVYGPKQAAGEYAGVMVKFLERLRQGRPPIIHGDGKQTRDFIHVDDAVEATLLVLERDGVAGEVINVGTGRETSIGELCKIFRKLMGMEDLQPTYERERPDDIKRSYANISKAKRLLGYEPEIELKQGIKSLLL